MTQLMSSSRTIPVYLLTVRYRYDGKGNRITTAEIIIDRAKVHKPTCVSELPRGIPRELLRALGYAPHLTAEEKAKIVDRTEAVVRILL